MSEVTLSVEPRTEFGKGAARRTRRAGKIPAVLYGHGSDPRHYALPALEFARVVRENGSNAVITLELEGKSELALTKTIVVHPLKNYIEHVDLLVVRRGEKVTVDVPVVVTGTAGPGTLVTTDLDTLQIEVEALHIPEQVELSVEGVEAGTQILASQVTLPQGATLVTDAEALVVAVNEAPSESSLEGEEAEAAETPAEDAE
ncbi:50S ribosomal protein L25/general stress protein Ctc [Amycolatopsis keratiniphila]|uniref:Large ribosomal subunit protein bL25 n=1 Tax=Amycolatopsis keratiniphila subsp. keratiniphila TaxID=227715 RepID=A0A1W2LIB0_9PSEU|nr:50S ribosomal protein L25/general stress protein Ctc [Amycolatopsis keratiniphila]OLZ54188.1 50S ribosomal protein L25/general stress protein Ctc [Amycolatopsis keratiniphila subsp. nogabecina]ONF62336.1 50S ribosomal protein L25/general stress protein Ctc [Amycolatopsis keratiniphila subsp. keratiniphila]SDU63659.1 large subunit ribosomal protein L25 [Amycolatopsis keratiniphila]